MAVSTPKIDEIRARLLKIRVFGPLGCTQVSLRAPRVIKPYKFIGFGAIAVTKPCEFMGFWVLAVTKPYEFMGFWGT